MKGSSGRAKLTKNVVCAAFGSAKSETTSKIPCSKPMSGRYVTLQPKANDYLMIAEVNILILKPVTTTTTTTTTAAPVASPAVAKSTGGATQAVSVAAMPAYSPSLCQEGADPYCDPNWTPFANMNNALMGYDVVNGDTLAKRGDPGFRNQIFGAVVSDDNGRMVLDDGISAIDLVKCESNFQSTTVTNLKEFNEAASSNYDVSASASGGFGGYGGNFGYQESGSAKTARESLESGEKVIMLTQAECLLHKLKLNTALLPGFTNQFVASLKALERITTSSSLDARRKAFFQFYNDYGTHYMTETRFGAKLIIETEYDKAETSERKLKEQERCRGVSIGFSSPIVNGEASANGCAGSSSDSSSSSSNERSKSTIISKGSRPKDDPSGNTGTQSTPDHGSLTITYFRLGQPGL